jgi:hypothetical protein
MPREFARQAEEPGTQSFGLRRSPAPAQRRGADDVQELVGQRAECPKQSVAADVIDRGLADRELPQLRDALLDERSFVVRSPGGEGMDRWIIGEDEGVTLDAVAAERQLALRVCRPCRSPFTRQQAHTVELAGRGPQVGVLRGGAPRACRSANPDVARHLQEEADVHVAERFDHLLREETLVHAHRDVVNAEPAQASYDLAKPRDRSGSGMRAAGPPHDAQAIARVRGERNQRMMTRSALLLRIVADFSSGLLLPVPDHHRGVQHDHDRRRRANLLPAPLNQQPQQPVEHVDEHFSRASQPTAKGRGVRNCHPTEQPTDTARTEQLQVIHPAAAVEQQDDPDLNHQRGPKASADLPGVRIQPLADPELIPHAPDQQQAASIGQLTAAVTHAQRSACTLNMRSGFDMMDSHRLGAFRCEKLLARKSAQRKASDGVSHHPITSRVQDPGSSLSHSS